MGEGHRIEIKQPETGPDAPPAPVKQEATSERPAWLPENFKSPEDLAKAFKDTQAELTRVKQGSKAPEPAKVEEAPKGEPKADEAAKAADDLTVEKAAEAVPKLDMAAFSEEYAKEGKLAEASYAKLEALGIGKDMVDAFIEGQKVIAAREEEEVFKIAGGKEEFSRVREWLASAEVSDEDREAFNKAVKGSAAERNLAIKAAVASFREIHGHEGRMISGQRSNESNSYASNAEIIADMRDARYDKDPAFRARVEAKIKNSRF